MPGIEVVQGGDMGAETVLSVGVGKVEGYKEGDEARVVLEGRAALVREGTVDVE